MTPQPDCIVVGGGVIGMAVARRLAWEGLRITLLERGTCGGEASWAGAGILAPCNPHRRDAVAAWQDRSLRLYEGFCKELHTETGIDPEYAPCGELDLLFTDETARIARSDELAGRNRRTPDGRPAYQWQSPEEVRRIEPAVSSEILGALECRITAQVRNPRLLQSLKQSCLNAGVLVREGTAVAGIHCESGRILGISIAPAERVHADSHEFPEWSDASQALQETSSRRLPEAERLPAARIVLCGGAWTSEIDARLQEVMPVHPVRGQMILLKAERRPFGHVISRGRTYLVPRRDGHILLGSTEEPGAGFTKRNTAEALSKLLDMSLRMVPSLAECPVAATWSGLRPGTPDDLPYLGPVPGMEGLIVATGHFRAGLTLAPVTAEYIADHIAGRPHEIDLSCCAPGRENIPLRSR